MTELKPLSDALLPCPFCNRVLVNPKGYAPSASVGVKAKPLEWVQQTSPREDGPRELVAEWEAEGVGFVYIIEEQGDEWFLTVADIMNSTQIGRSGDPDNLRNVAQADYETRILSALLPQGVPVVTEGGWIKFKAGDVAQFFPHGVVVDVRTETGDELLGMAPVDVNFGYDSSVVAYRVRTPAALSEGKPGRMGE